MRLAEDFDAGHGLDWYPPGADADYLQEPGELFEQDWMDRHILDGEELENAYSRNAPLWRFLSDPGPDRLRAHLSAGRAVLVEEGFVPVVFPWETADAVLPRFEMLLDEIGFVRVLKERMQQIRNALSGTGSTAYHIRRGDILNKQPWTHTTWPAKIEADELYELHIERNPDTPAVLFSDTPRVVQRMKRAYPWLLTIDDMVDLNDLTPAQGDLVELYAMSRADRIVAPIISAFSTAAARLSGRERLIFNEVLSGEDRATASNRLQDRLSGNLDTFVSPSEAAHLYSKLHQDLTAQDKVEDAYEIARRLLEAGADNAFLPILQVLNCLYLGKLPEGDRLAQDGLENPNLWPSDHAVLAAARAVILGARGKKWQAGVEFVRAFWAKPTRPDVAVLASRLIYRNQIPLRLMPPADWALQADIVRDWYPPFNNLYLVQWRLIRKRPANFDALLLDWHALALDQRARRIVQDRSRLLALAGDLGNAKTFGPDTPEHAAMRAMIDFRLGASPVDSRKPIEAALGQQPTNPLYLLRLAVLHEANGDPAAARMALTDALALRPADAFVTYQLAELFSRQGFRDQSTALYLDAARRESGTPSIQGQAGHALMQAGRLEEALPFLEAAHRLCPTYGRYRNQMDRVRQKLGRAPLTGPVPD